MIRRFTDLLEEGGNRSSGTASSDEDNNSSSLGGVADERSKTNSHYDADAYSNDHGYSTYKDNVLWRWEPLDGVRRLTDSFDGLGGGDTARSASGLRRRAAGGKPRKTPGTLRISEGGRWKPSTRILEFRFRLYC